jgi:hypothetical protein
MITVTVDDVEANDANPLIERTVFSRGILRASSDERSVTPSEFDASESNISLVSSQTAKQQNDRANIITTVRFALP